MGRAKWKEKKEREDGLTSDGQSSSDHETSSDGVPRVLLPTIRLDGAIVRREETFEREKKGRREDVRAERRRGGRSRGKEELLKLKAHLPKHRSFLEGGK